MTPRAYEPRFRERAAVTLTMAIIVVIAVSALKAGGVW